MTVVVTSSWMRPCIFMVINHRGISFLPAYSSGSAQDVAAARHSLATSWGMNVLRLRACMTLTWQLHRVHFPPEVIR